MELPEEVLGALDHQENCRIAILQTERFFVDNYRTRCFVIAVPTVGPTSVRIEKVHYTIPVGTFFIVNPEQELRPPDSGVAEGLYLILVHASFFHDICRMVCENHVKTVPNGPFPVGPESLQYIRLFLKEADQQQAGFMAAQEAASSLLLISFLRNIDQEKCRTQQSCSTRYAGNIEQAKEFLQNSLTDPFSLEKTSRVAQLSPYYFTRVFRQYTGMTPYEYLVAQRINRARTLLETSTLTVKEICFSCGFNNSSHFTTLFRKRTGIRPSEYRVQSREKLSTSSS